MSACVCIKIRGSDLPEQFASEMWTIGIMASTTYAHAKRNMDKGTMVHRLWYSISCILYAKGLSYMPRGLKVSHLLIANELFIINISNFLSKKIFTLWHLA